MKTPKEIENPGPTPEQLLKILHAELAVQRSHREGATRKRATVLVLGVLFIVGAAGAALLVLNQMVADLRHRGSPESTVTATESGNF